MTPDLATTHVIALRVFELNPKTMTLESLTANGGDKTWIPGEIKRSVCGHLRQTRHNAEVAPELTCTCGIWSCKSRAGLARALPHFFYTIRHYSKYPLYVSARIEQWGVVIEHDIGYRSEYARIIPDTIQVFPRSKLSKRHDRVIKYLREKYDPRPV